MIRQLEKEHRSLLKAYAIIQKARKRAVGQAYKDDGRWFTKPTKISYTKREQKILNKIGNIVGKDKIKKLEKSHCIGLDID